jgi:hypothetical protein
LSRRKVFWSTFDKKEEKKKKVKRKKKKEEKMGNSVGINKQKTRKEINDEDIVHVYLYNLTRGTQANSFNLLAKNTILDLKREIAKLTSVSENKQGLIINDKTIFDNRDSIKNLAPKYSDNKWKLEVELFFDDQRKQPSRTKFQ